MAIRRFLMTAGFGALGGGVGLALLSPSCSASVLDYTGYTVTGDSITIDTPILTSGVAGLIHLITPSGTVDAWCLDVYDMLSGSGTYNVGPVHPPVARRSHPDRRPDRRDRRFDGARRRSCGSPSARGQCKRRRNRDCGRNLVSRIRDNVHIQLCGFYCRDPRAPVLQRCDQRRMGAVRRIFRVVVHQ